MKTTSGQSKKTSITCRISALRRLLYRFTVAALVISCPQFSGIGIAQAEEPSQAEAVAAAAADGRDPQNVGDNSISSKPETVLNTEYEKEVHCLALNIYFEARSEPETGQRAVGHVVMNRVAHPRYPDSVCEVVRQGGEEQLHRCQFSWWCDGLSDKPVNRKAWDRSLRLARELYLGILKDTTDGALWYHATYVNPYWSKILLRGDKIGQHIFYLENRQANNAL